MYSEGHLVGQLNVFDLILAVPHLPVWNVAEMAKQVGNMRNMAEHINRLSQKCSIQQNCQSRCHTLYLREEIHIISATNILSSHPTDPKSLRRPLLR